VGIILDEFTWELFLKFAETRVLSRELGTDRQYLYTGLFFGVGSLCALDEWYVGGQEVGGKWIEWISVL
jgi:hypothetical protein